MIVYGDGSFGLNGFEYDTAVRFGLPIIGIVGNDAAWGQMMRPQGAIYGMFESTLLNPRATTRSSRRSAATASSSSGPSRSAPRSSAPPRRASRRCVNVIIRQDREYKGGIYV